MEIKVDDTESIIQTINEDGKVETVIVSKFDADSIPYKGLRFDYSKYLH